MKKLIILFAALLTTISGFAQLSELSVCGIKMGTSKDQAKSILKERFGVLSVSEESGNLQVYDGYVGGISHKFMTFYFAWIDGKSMLNGARFSTPYELGQQQDAINHRELIKDIYERKYELSEYKNDDGFKCYYFGETDKIYTTYGEIMIHKLKSNDGKTRLYTDVYYFGPYSESEDI